MKTILLTLSAVFAIGQTATILPVESKSTVQVKSNGGEYAYTIHENKAIPLAPIPVIPLLENKLLKIEKDSIPDKDLIGDKLQLQLQLQSTEKLKTEEERSGIDQNKVKLETSGGQHWEKPSEQLYIPTYPGYKLIPNPEVQLFEYPSYYYYPYYAYHYPHVRFL
ncbi:unnamed protein product [Phyllotreta striolata]|uniref:Uncharacterized protein n=1 Tax=Phyllotreta striolata TaxID=444603 RepID=A0A9N9TPG9_PHYSR|nr:unnamed protein product [Phyllotreta striolata]